MLILTQPWYLLLLLILPILWRGFRSKHYLSLPSLEPTTKSSNWHFLHILPMVLFSLGLTAIIIAIARPQLPYADNYDTIKTRDIILAVDVSGSMGVPFNGTLPPPEAENELNKGLPKIVWIDETGKRILENDRSLRRIDAAESAITRFVHHRFTAKQSDRIGILLFDFYPKWSWPLSDDLKMIYRKGVFLRFNSLAGGTNFGNFNPGPIDEAAQHFDEEGKTASRILILVSDGEDKISPEAMSRLEKKLKERHIRFYVIGVGEILARNDVDIIRLAQNVGGKIYRVESANQMIACFDEINELERSRVQIPSRSAYKDVFAYFAFAGLCFTVLAMISSSFLASS